MSSTLLEFSSAANVYVNRKNTTNVFFDVIFFPKNLFSANMYVQF